MSKLLVINAHPEVDSTSSFSLNVLNYFLKIYKERHSKDEAIEQISLYNDVIPMIDQTVLSAWGKQRNGEELTSEEQEVTRRMNEVLQQFKRLPVINSVACCANRQNCGKIWRLKF